MAAESGLGEAQSFLASMYEEGNSAVRQDYSEAFRWNLLAANGNVLSSQDSVCKAYYEGLGTERDYIEAGRWCFKAAMGGEPYSQYVLGLMYAKGLGVKTDYEEAARWLGKSVSTYSKNGQEDVKECTEAKKLLETITQKSENN